MRATTTLKKSAIALACTLACTGYTSAQQVTASEPAMQRVEITGSSIKRTEAETAGAVQVLTREDIERTGETTALGILTSTAAVSTSLNTATQGAATFANGSSAVSMRGVVNLWYGRKKKLTTLSIGTVWVPGTSK